MKQAANSGANNMLHHARYPARYPTRDSGARNMWSDSIEDENKSPARIISKNRQPAPTLTPYSNSANIALRRTPALPPLSTFSHALYAYLSVLLFVPFTACGAKTSCAKNGADCRLAGMQKAKAQRHRQPRRSDIVEMKWFLPPQTKPAKSAIRKSGRSAPVRTAARPATRR